MKDLIKLSDNKEKIDVDYKNIKQLQEANNKYKIWKHNRKTQ